MATPNRRTKNAVSAAKLDRRIFCKGATVAMGAAMLAPTMGRAVLAADAPVSEIFWLTSTLLAPPKIGPST